MLSMEVDAKSSEVRDMARDNPNPRTSLGR